MYIDLGESNNSLFFSDNLYMVIFFSIKLKKIWILYFGLKDKFVDKFWIWFLKVKAKLRYKINIFYTNRKGKFISIKLKTFWKKERN